MGWFSSSPSKPTAPRPSSDGAFEAPNRTDRVQCWESRDIYFECLNTHNIIDSVKEKASAEKYCGKEGQKFEKTCASSWVHYFKKRRVVEHNKEETMKRLQAEGAQPLPSSTQ